MVRDWLVGIDVGGTFTDGVLLRPLVAPLAIKSPTDHHDPMAGLRACLDRLAEAAATSRRQLLARTTKFAYGTTQAANLLVEGGGARTGFITTRGFRDTLIIAGIGRERIGLDLTNSRPPPLVPRRLIHEVRERIDAQGREVAPLNAGDVRAAMAAFEAEGVEAVGVCLLWSFRNPAHELAIAEMVRGHDGWFVTTSTEVAPLMGEYERSATTALNARLGPPVRRHLTAVELQLREDGLQAPLLVMQSSGGLLPIAEAAARPVTLLASGPAGGVLAGKLLADAMGLPNVLCVDMGGTTFDVSLITNGELATRDRSQHAGQDLFIPAIDVHSIGAGGGSVGWIDHGARLKVGPQSAGSQPGPACYGRGGKQATVSDANYWLGRINPEGLAGGRVALDREAARLALTALGEPLGLDPLATAEGMIAIVDAAMADAIRTQTVRRGLDPADYVLLAYGGAGALHAAALAQELGIGRVVVPLLAPVLSAYGVVASDLLHVLARTEARPLTDPEPIAATFARLEAEGQRFLDADGVVLSRRALVRSAQIRFIGQLHAVEVSVAPGQIDQAFLGRLREDFLRNYERLFGPGTSSAEAGVEAITLRVDAIGKTSVPALAASPAPPVETAPDGRRQVWWQGRPCDAGRFRGPLPPGHRLLGPAVVDHEGNTVWVPPGTTAQIDGWGNLVMEIV
jgi:N-methylhydantoinase A